MIQKEPKSEWVRRKIGRERRGGRIRCASSPVTSGGRVRRTGNQDRWPLRLCASGRAVGTRPDRIEPASRCSWMGHAFRLVPGAFPKSAPAASAATHY